MEDVYVGKIIECFDIEGRGRVVVLETNSTKPLMRVKDKLLLRLSNQETLFSSIQGLEMINYGPSNKPRFDVLPLLLSDIQTLDKEVLRNAELYKIQ